MGMGQQTLFVQMRESRKKCCEHEIWISKKNMGKVK